MEQGHWRCCGTFRIPVSLGRSVYVASEGLLSLVPVTRTGSRVKCMQDLVMVAKADVPAGSVILRVPAVSGMTRNPLFVLHFSKMMRLQGTVKPLMPSLRFLSSRLADMINAATGSFGLRFLPLGSNFGAMVGALKELKGCGVDRHVWALLRDMMDWCMREMRLLDRYWKACTEDMDVGAIKRMQAINKRTITVPCAAFYSGHNPTGTGWGSFAPRSPWLG